MVESQVTTKIKVTSNTKQLKMLKGLIPGLDSLVDDIENRIDIASGKLAQRTAEQLLEYERKEFNYHHHPFERGVGGNSFYAKINGKGLWVVDNSANNKGFPYMVTEELGDNPGRKLPAHPFAAPSRDVVIGEVERLFNEVWG